MKDKDKNEIVASVAIIIHKNSAYYWWGASIDEKEVGINKYLLWKSMNIIKDEYYKNGGIILADRYTTANMVHQAGKIYDKEDFFLQCAYTIK